MKKNVMLKMIILLIYMNNKYIIHISKKICLKKKINKMFQIKTIQIKLIIIKKINNKTLKILSKMFLVKEIILMMKIFYMIKLKEFRKKLKYLRILKKIKTYIILIFYLN